ncbi:hypothetical protein GGX14DRAFT_603845 [Mycena pura]|uniref:Uncharacterized protein n=1 Tax=Mycena pura TaxID=153505 RepID=A0AAD6Y060_9AGAR|nr:hypothetical protein GGX14DRAFT_603845 [Mycena pura]
MVNILQWNQTASDLVTPSETLEYPAEGLGSSPKGLVEIAAASHCADAQPQKCATAGTIAAAHVTSRRCSMCAQRTSATRLPPPYTQTLRQHALLCTSLSSLPQAQSNCRCHTSSPRASRCRARKLSVFAAADTPEPPPPLMNCRRRRQAARQRRGGNLGIFSCVIGMGPAKLRRPVRVPQYTRMSEVGAAKSAAVQAAAARRAVGVPQRMCCCGLTAAANVTLPQSHGAVHEGLPQGVADCRRFVPTAQPQLRHFSLPLPQLPQLAEPEYDASGVMNILSAAAQPQMHICGTANCALRQFLFAQSQAVLIQVHVLVYAVNNITHAHFPTKNWVPVCGVK